MKLIRCLVLFPAVFVMVAMLVSCSSVGFAEEPKKTYTHIKSQVIETPQGPFLVDLDPVTQCAIEVKTCETCKPLKGKSIEEVFKVKVIEVPGSPCNSFTGDAPGNSYCYCSGGWCYCY